MCNKNLDLEIVIKTRLDFRGLLCKKLHMQFYYDPAKSSGANCEKILYSFSMLVCAQASKFVHFLYCGTFTLKTAHTIYSLIQPVFHASMFLNMPYEKVNCKLSIVYEQN